MTSDRNHQARQLDDKRNARWVTQIRNTPQDICLAKTMSIFWHMRMDVGKAEQNYF
jgi:hypothetical protein